MAWNNAAMTLAANALRGAALYGQLHSAAAGGSYTSNLCASGRQSVTWAAVTGAGSFGLSTTLTFTGGTPGGAVYSITFWSGPSGGTCYGEFPLTGDLVFNSAGVYIVTAIDETGSAT